MSRYCTHEPCTLSLRTVSLPVDHPSYHERQVPEPRPQSTSRTYLCLTQTLPFIGHPVDKHRPPVPVPLPVPVLASVLPRSSKSLSTHVPFREPSGTCVGAGRGVSQADDGRAYQTVGIQEQETRSCWSSRRIVERDFLLALMASCEV
jgi:hypothetical protein